MFLILIKLLKNTVIGIILNPSILAVQYLEVLKDSDKIQTIWQPKSNKVLLNLTRLHKVIEQ